MQDMSNDQDGLSDKLGYVSFTLEIIAFVITALNLIALYADFVTTIRFAPQEIRDAFGNLRQQIGEERLALQHQAREVRRKMRYRRKVAKAERKRQVWDKDGAGAAVTVEHRGPALRAEPPPPLLSGDGTLALHCVTLGDLWVRFRRLEKPFLAPRDGNRAENGFSERNVPKKSEHEKDEEYSFSFSSWSSDCESELESIKAVDTSAASVAASDMLVSENKIPSPKYGRFPATGRVTKFELAELSAMYRCDFVHRFMWWRVKDEVKNLGDMVTKVMLRRMEREVTQTRLMQLQMRLGVDTVRDDNWLNGEWDLADSKMVITPGASQMTSDREGSSQVPSTRSASTGKTFPWTEVAGEIPGAGLISSLFEPF